MTREVKLNLDEEGGIVMGWALGMAHGRDHVVHVTHE